MNSQDFRKLLESEPNKLKVFEDREILTKCNFTVPDFCSLIQDFLTDEEKLKLFDFSHFQNLQKDIRLKIVKTINDYNLTIKALLSPTNKDFNEFNFKDILESKDESEIIKMLENKELVTERFNFSEYDITDFIKEFSNDDDKKRLMDFYELNESKRSNIVKTFKFENKLEEIKKDDLSVFSKIELIRTLNSNELLQFINENKEFLNENNIDIYNITADMDDKSQLDFVKHLEDFDITLNEKREVLALLNETAKEQLDLDSFPEEYRTALEMYKPEFSSRINIDLDKDLERYKGLDNIISVCPEDFDENQRAKFLKLCNICPDMSVISNIGVLSSSSNPAEYIETEAWISSVLEKLKPEYSDIQKLAIIDNEYGKRTSYSANFKTETYNEWDSRALWKILSTNELGAINGGVCNGHAHAVEYICKRAGIENVRMVEGPDHAFLKIENIEIPLANGETVKGNTILDPTWNLSNNRFGGKPDNFLISYETARKHDIDKNGKDRKCHQNDEDLKDATLELDEKSLTRIFSSVGLADENGNFPISKTIEKSEEIDKLYANQPKQNIKEQLLLLEEICPEFATCPNSSMKMIADVLLNRENQHFDRCITDRVYDKEDENKTPVLYVYVKSQDIGEVFFHASMEEGKFEESSREDFEKKFECYNVDLENGLTPWEIEKEQEEKEENLAASSGSFEKSDKIVEEEGEER